MSDQEKEFDDEVYEDTYYEDEEELEEEDDEDENSKKDDDAKDYDDDDDDEVEIEKKIHLSFVCDDCDYRWDDVVLKIKGNLEDEVDYDDNQTCPMCGSMNTSRI
jgi:hypothetical protein